MGHCTGVTGSSFLCAVGMGGNVPSCAPGERDIHGHCTIIPGNYPPQSQPCHLHPDVVELECEVMLPLAAGSGELFEAMRLVLL